MLRLAGCILVLIALESGAGAQITRPLDAPRPLEPDEAAGSFRLPPGFRMELVASEPLIHEPSGVCWDEWGRMWVTELHGYNLEGQYDIDDLNRTGELDRVVRRIQANDRAKKEAEKGTYGVVKRLVDTDGDGRMDRAVVVADGMPPAYGLVPARGGVIVACAPDILYLADRDGDGIAEVREVMFTGFKVGLLERGVNAPQWGPDQWIYFGRGHGGGRITGPHLEAAVEIGGTDFRIRADGSAIEPVEGATHTFGHTFTDGGDRMLISTSVPGIFVVPLPWRYLARNPDAVMPRLEETAGDYTRVYPLAPPHPWRVKRAEDPGFFKYYRDRYGVSDSDAGGYFTSGCSPLVYRDVAFPPEYRGHYFMCEPAGNLVHHARMSDDGPAVRLRRAPGQETSEFLASTDGWFHPMHLVHGPEGAVYVVDFYREIIEDYSAIPRYLQQQYGLTNGMAHGRIWRLTHASAPSAPSSEMVRLADHRLAAEVGSPHAWRRETARRLLVERRASSVADLLARHLSGVSSSSAAINALYTLDGLDVFRDADLQAGWSHTSADVRRHALRIADRRFDGPGRTLAERLLSGDWRKASDEPRLLLQVAASLGESRDDRVPAVLASLAREHGDVRWMDAAVTSSAYRRERAVVGELLARPGKGGAILEGLVAIVAGRGETNEIRLLREAVAGRDEAKLGALLTRILDAGWEEATRGETGALGSTPPIEVPSADELSAVEKALPDYLKALGEPRDVVRGRELFVEHCSTCHVAKGAGTSVGPSLDAEHQRAEETVLRDILFPHETLTAGFETQTVQPKKGPTVEGILVSESPTSVSLRLPAGAEVTFLKKRLASSKVRRVSLMPSTFSQVLTPRDLADIVGFVRAK